MLALRDVAPLLSDGHISGDGTLVKAWAPMESFQPRAADAPPDDVLGNRPKADRVSVIVVRPETRAAFRPNVRRTTHLDPDAAGV